MPEEVETASDVSLLGMVGRLSIEVQEEVYQHLPRSDLARLCLVCRALRTIVEPLLYEDVRFDYRRRGDCAIFRSLPPGGGAPIPGADLFFARTVMARPELGRHVRSLTLIQGGDFPGFSKWDMPVRLKESPLEGFVRATGLPYAEDWAERLDTSDARAALVLCLVPNIRKLHLLLSHWCRFLTEVIRTAVCAPSSSVIPAFDNLRHISLAKPGFSYLAVGTKDILSFLYLPSLETFRGCFFHPYELSWPDIQNRPSHNLSKLDVSDLDGEYVADLLKAFATTVTGFRWGMRARYGDVDFSHTLESLWSIRNIVSDLTLRYELDGLYSENAKYNAKFVSRGSLRRLREFSRLTHVELPIVFLCSSSSSPPTDQLEDILPPSIEMLTLNDDDCWGHSDLLLDNEAPKLSSKPAVVLGAWLSDGIKKSPHLRRICLRISLAKLGSEWRQQWRDEIRELSPPDGVEMRIVEDELDPILLEARD